MAIERRRRRWYAALDIPKDVRAKIGKRRRFVKSLETEDKRVAERRAAPLIAAWKLQIERARRGTNDPIEEDARFWRETLRQAKTPAEREEILSIVGDKADAIVNDAAWKAGIIDPESPDYGALPELQDAKRFYDIATGNLVPFDEHVDEWLKTLGNEPKTLDLKRGTITRFAEECPTIREVSRKRVQEWTNRRVLEEGKAPATMQRALSELRGYWRYLASIEVVPEDTLPFDRIQVPKPPRKNGGSGYAPFTAAEVVTLLKAAEEKGDNQVADLIRLAMWTGARIEELCALRVESVAKDSFKIEDAKTEAGIREVPIHPKLEETMKRLVKASKDGYVLSGLPSNKYGDRSGAPGKRFATLKRNHGFAKRKHCFHSIRKTVATLLENAGVPENIAADIIGHDKPTMTYGVYSGGASLNVKREALEKIDYPE